MCVCVCVVFVCVCECVYVCVSSVCANVYVTSCFCFLSICEQLINIFFSIMCAMNNVYNTTAGKYH